MIREKGYIESACFTFYLGFKDDDSELVIGGFNPDKIKPNSNFSYHNVVSASRWTIVIDKMQLGSTDISLNGAKINSIVDSGTSLISFNTYLYN